MARILVSSTPHRNPVVKARKLRICSRLNCKNEIRPGDQWLDVDPPMRQSGYFATCGACAVESGLAHWEDPN